MVSPSDSVKGAFELGAWSFGGGGYSDGVDPPSHPPDASILPCSVLNVNTTEVRSPSAPILGHGARRSGR